MKKPRQPQDPRTKLLRRLQKGVRVSRRHDVEYAGDGQERLTCRHCGLVTVQRVGAPHASMSEAMAKKLAAYRGHGSGVFGECPRCTRWERDVRYPTFSVDGIKNDEHVIHVKFGTGSLQVVYIKVDDEVNLRVGKTVQIRKPYSGTRPFTVVVTAECNNFFRVDLV